MRPDPPTRLGATKSSDPDLVRALEALGSTQADSARVARVGQKLGPLLDAPLPAAHAASGVAGLWSKSVLLKLLGATGAVVVAVSWPSSELTAPEPTAHVAEVEAPPATPQAMEPAPAAPPAQAAPPPAQAAPAAESPTTLVEPPAKQAEASLARARRPVPATPVASPPRRPARSTQPQAAPARSNAVKNARAVAASGAAEPSLPSVSAAPEPVIAPQSAKAAEIEAPTPPLPSETDLLLSARRQLRHDPRAALNLLAQHETRFPHGMLGPEREVLAVDALRALGNEAAAQARLARFRKNYPDSLHLVDAR